MINNNIIAKIINDNLINLINYFYALMCAYSGFSKVSHSRNPVKHVNDLKFQCYYIPSTQEVIVR